MRKSLWIILAVLFVAIGAPNAHADSFAPTFTGGPTAPDVTFPSPTLTISFDGITFTIVLGSADLPGDQYTWTEASFPDGLGGDNLFNVRDVTTNDFQGDEVDTDFRTSGGSGNLTFTSTSVAAPEPSSVALLLLGIGLVFAMRKRNSRSHQLAT
jgi:hypothetical protein